MDKMKNLFINTLRLLNIFIITIISIQLILIPAFGESVDHKDGYDVISYDNGTKEIISGALNYQKWDGTWQPIDEMDISKGNWPYLFSENETTAEIQVDDTKLTVPKGNAKFKPKFGSIGYELKFSKQEFEGKKQDINATDASLDFSYDIGSKIPKPKYSDDYNIREGRLHFKGGVNNVVVHDDTLRDYVEDGKVIKDFTYLIPPEYDFKIENGEIRLKFKKSAIDKLQGNITVDIQGWGIDAATDSSWGSDTTFVNTAAVRATGKGELRQKITDYVMYTRFDEAASTIIHNENPNVPSTDPDGDLLGTVGTGTWTNGKYGKAIHFDGVKNKVLFWDDPELRLPYDFTISYFIQLTSDVNNLDTDITRKGSTATADPDQWYKVEIKSNKMQGVVYKGGTEIAEKDTSDRRNGNWYFVAYTRQGTTCSLSVDGTVVASRSNCPTNTVNSAQLAIGAKDTETSGTGMDYTHGTIDEVRFFKRKLSSTDLSSIRNNEHLTSGTITRNLASVIGAGQEVKGLACDGNWIKPTTRVDVLASTDNVNWNTIQSNADPNVLYSVPSGNNYRYSRCSLSTTDASITPEISSLRATIGPIGMVGQGILVFGRGTDQGVWYKSYSGSTWSGWTNLGGAATSNISAVIYNSDTYVFVRGSDNGLYYRKMSGTTWGGWTSLGGILTSDPEAIVSGSDLYVFIRDSSNGLMYRKLSGTTWNGWTGLGGTLTSGPDTSIFGSELHVFVRGTGNGLWYKKLSGSTWSGWQSLEGILTSNPESAPNDVFVKGTDNALYYKRLSSATWSSWLKLGGIAASNPDAVPNDVFVRGTDSAVWHNKWGGSAWSGWQSLGGITMSDPESVASGTDTYIFIHGSDNALWYRKQTGGIWSGWTNLGGILTSHPTAVLLPN